LAGILQSVTLKSQAPYNYSQNKGVVMVVAFNTLDPTTSRVPLPSPRELFNAIDYGKLKEVQNIIARASASSNPEAILNSPMSPEDDSTPLHRALQSGAQFAIIKALIDALKENSCDLHVLNSSCGTPLHLAAYLDNLAAAVALIKAGARKSVTNREGHTAHDWAHSLRMTQLTETDVVE